MTRRMNKTNILFLALLVVVTLGAMELLKTSLGAPYAYAIGAAILAALVLSLFRK